MEDWIEALVGGGGAIAGGLLTKDAYDKLGGIGDTAITEMTELGQQGLEQTCLLYTSPSPRDRTRSRMPSSA